MSNAYKKSNNSSNLKNTRLYQKKYFNTGIKFKKINRKKLLS